MIRIIKEDIDFDNDFNKFDFGDENAEWYDSIDIPKECIKGATLLSKEEYEKYKDIVPFIDWSWWLRTPGRKSFNICAVGYGGDVYNSCSVQGVSRGTRPALLLDLQSSNFNVGDKFEFGKYLFTILSNGLAICDDFIGKERFRKNWQAEDANVYEKSDVKKVVDNWFNEAYRNYK